MYMDSCIFCKIIHGKINSRKIYETAHSMVILDAFPLKEGHTLIISKNHKSKIQELSIEENKDIFSTLHFIVDSVEKIVEGNSTLVAIHNGENAGQEIPHLHIHIIPVKKTEKQDAIHSMFTKKKFSDDKLDIIWKNLTNKLQK